LNKQSKLADEKEKDALPSISTGSSAEYYAKQILNGAEYLSKGVSKTAEYATQYMQKGSQQIKSKIEPNPQPTKVDPKVQSLLKNVNYGTTVTVRVSSYLVNKLGSIATATAKKVAPHIKQGSKTLLSKSGVVSNESTATNYVDNAFMVASHSMQGFAIVYDSLEQAAKTLAKNFTEHTVNVVDYK
jgi:spartin